jgi:hypothetical protein
VAAVLFGTWLADLGGPTRKGERGENYQGAGG